MKEFYSESGGCGGTDGGGGCGVGVGVGCVSGWDSFGRIAVVIIVRVQ